MIKQIENDDKGILAFEVAGKITQKEVIQTIDVIETAIQTRDRFNLYIEVAELSGVEMAAMKERFAYIFSNHKQLLKKVKKVSLVSDKNWLQKFAEGLYYLIPSIEQKSFSFEDKEQARHFVGLVD